MTARLAVVDYGAGNLHSIVKALEALGTRPVVTDDPADLSGAAAIVFPGQGSACDAMFRLRGRHLVNPLAEAIAAGTPFLGVCLGMQVLLDLSTEGREQPLGCDEPCLGIVQGTVRRLPALPGLKIPHMGWNAVHPVVDSPLFSGIPDGMHFYHVHSYYADVEDTTLVAATTDHGITFATALWRGSFMATQFHPEKSGYWGLRLLENFLHHAGLSTTMPATALAGSRSCC